MSGVQVVTSREVPLGGPRAMRVRRTLPQRERSLVGAWCFVDHYGPEDVAASGGMDVPPHPHTGLQTVSWLFSGEVEHRDSGGVHALVRPGELNLMTAGSGVAHSEVSTPATTVLHGVQLWVALPDAARERPRGFDHHVPTPVGVDGGTVRLLLGRLVGDTSPVPTHTPLLAAEVVVDAGAEVVLEVEPTFEHGVLVDRGPVLVDGTEVLVSDLGYRAAGEASLSLRNEGTAAARVLLLGGEPFTEPVLMWWNLVARTHEEIVALRAAWESPSERFGQVEGYVGDVRRLPAPPLPGTRLKPRLTPPGAGDRSAWG